MASPQEAVNMNWTLGCGEGCMDDILVSADSRRRRLIRKAKDISIKARAENRTHFTPREEVELDQLMREYQTARMVENIKRNGSKDEGSICRPD